MSSYSIACQSIIIQDLQIYHRLIQPSIYFSVIKMVLSYFQHLSHVLEKNAYHAQVRIK